MPEWLSLLLAVLGGGVLTGAGTFLRARGQNKVDAQKLAVDDRSALFKDTREWLAYQDAQIENLIKRNEVLEARLLAQAEKQASQDGARAAEIADLRRQNHEQAEQIVVLQKQDTEKTVQIEALTDERQQYIETLAKVQARAEWLEAALNIEREDNRRLREQLPQRVEVDKG